MRSTAYIILVFLVITGLPSTAAVLPDDVKTSGTISIQGDENEIEWDDDGVSKWDANGNVRVEFTDEDGNVSILTGDSLRYIRSFDGEIIRYYVHVQGNVRFTQGEYSIGSDEIEGYLDPIGLGFRGAVNFNMTDLQLTTESMGFLETGEGRYHIEAFEDATVILTREIAASGPTEIAPTGNSLPFPVEMNFDFRTITIDAPVTEINLIDGEMASAEFPYGIVGTTDTDYLFSTGGLTIESGGLITGANCRVVGSEAIIRATAMKLNTSEKKVELLGRASIISQKGSLSMDSLTIIYDDHGICTLAAEGNIVLDFSLTLTDEDVSLRPLIPADLKKPGGEEDS